MKNFFMFIGSAILLVALIGITPAFVAYTAADSVPHFIMGLAYLGAMWGWFMGAMGGFESQGLRWRDMAGLNVLYAFAFVAIAEAVFFSPLIALAILVFPVGCALPEMISEHKRTTRWMRVKLAESFLIKSFGNHPSISEIKIGHDRPGYYIAVNLLRKDPTLTIPNEVEGIPIETNI